MPQEKILLFGGSFDPPHIGHMNLLQHGIAATAPGAVLVVPAGTPPHKAETRAPAALRLAMCECFRPLFPHLEISDMELVRGGKSYTIDTVQQVKSQHPGAVVYLLVGGDMLVDFPKWHRWRQLLSQVVLVAAGREKHTERRLAEAAEYLRAQGGNVIMAEGEVVPAASSEIREAIAAGQRDAYFLIPPPADEIVRQNGLYAKVALPLAGDVPAGETGVSVDEAERRAKQMLSGRRFQHTQNVVRAAEALATRFGADTEKARLAAWLHDIVKEYGRDELLQLLRQDAIIAGSTQERPLPIWHGPCGAIYAKQRCGVEDEEILDAISCHTTGRVGMTLMDKVLFLADVISEERTFEGVDEIRRLAYSDMDAAVVAAMEENIRYLQRIGKKLDTHTVEALQAMGAGSAPLSE